ncbi:Uncharacterized protein dnl_25840 [Desulfonema limicola]|uniref:Lipoprotein n=1 Tax=Desulfonema limicola TaxID=45656 RepID=A0A975B7H6_9BACT|nr:hypothetical protein [Desulfonema limicola]QTA80287.1 Uncharacterized protein dnl_25840 [Desulfonema limicola]
MMTKFKKCVIWVCFSVMAVLPLIGSGCSGLRTGQDSQGIGPGSTPLYYSFSDVLIPGELKEDKKSSYIIQSQGFSAGILSFRGRVERGSLIAFFKENMARDNWETIGSFVSSRSILLFQKESRWCVINIAEGDFYTHVEIGVVPSASGS